MYKRVLLIVAVFLTAAVSGYLFLKPNPKKKLSKALLCLKEEDYPAAVQALKAAQIPHDAFYRGYLEQAQGHFENSDSYLLRAYHEAKKNQDLKLQLEILAARSVNAYNSQNDQAIPLLLDEAHLLSSETSHITFFDGLASYSKQDYAEALRLWNKSSTTGCGEWSVILFEKLFPPVWKKLHIAHCLIETGDIPSAREILEKENHYLDKIENAEMTHLSALFLGLSYLKESHSVPFDQRGSYYKLACFYFDHAQMGEALIREKNRAVDHVSEEACALLLADLDPEKRKWGFDFIHILHEWQAKEAIELLADAIAGKLAAQKGEESICYCEAIRTVFLNTPFHLRLTEKMLSALTSVLKRGNSEDLLSLWSLVECLSPSPKSAAMQIASLTSEEIFETIKKDAVSLPKTRCYIAFWEKLSRSPAEREQLTHNLLFHAKLFWQNAGQEKKGLRLMDIALKISGHPSYVAKDIENFLSVLYLQAENSNMIRRLSLVYEAMEHFQINRQEIASKARIANHLADAEYLYEVHNYPSAKTHASWVLKLDPHNEKARRIVGLCAFNLGEYNKALCHLQELKDPDEDACKALMLSQVFASQERGKHLCHIDASDSFDENE